MLFRQWLEATEPYQPQEFNPALMTWDEFWQAVNSKNKSHDSSAYNWDLRQFTKRRQDYPELLFRKNLNGITFEFRVKKEDRYEGKYVKSNDNHGITYYEPDELPSIIKNRYEHSFGVFDGEQQVATAQDEWGCVLVAVAREYRGFGIAPILNRLAWDAEPGKDTGGCTPAGARMVQKTHQSYVRDYLRKGMYSYLVQQGVLRMDRVKQILASARVSEPPKQQSGAFNMQTNNPADFLLYGENGCFVMYNRRLREYMQHQHSGEEQFGYWQDRFIKGTCFVGGGYVSTDRLFLHQLGGDTPQILRMMVQLALSYAAAERLPMHVYDDDIPHVTGLATLNGNLATLNGPPISYAGMVRQEAAWRRSFDRYDEFKSTILELAEAKYR